MKSCENCNRITIGRNFEELSVSRITFGLIFIYLPILLLPFILVAAGLVYVHLRMMGAEKLKTLSDFLPDHGSHRYNFSTQILYRGAPKHALWARSKLFWLFNCTWYCPFSVATLEWATYLVKAVENWWCPFYHDKKRNYLAAAIDRSYWHNAMNMAQLNEDDLENPIYNEQANVSDREATRTSPVAGPGDQSTSGGSCHKRA